MFLSICGHIFVALNILGFYDQMINEWLSSGFVVKVFMKNLWMKGKTCDLDSLIILKMWDLHYKLITSNSNLFKRKYKLKLCVKHSSYLINYKKFEINIS